MCRLDFKGESSESSTSEKLNKSKKLTVVYLGLFLFVCIQENISFSLSRGTQNLTAVLEGPQAINSNEDTKIVAYVRDNTCIYST
jgi:hypothetical protein